MESTETIHKSLHPLHDGWFIEEVELDRAKDYWLGKTGDDERVYLSNVWGTALKMAEAKIA